MFSEALCGNAWGQIVLWSRRLGGRLLGVCASRHRGEEGMQMLHIGGSGPLSPPQM